MKLNKICSFISEIWRNFEKQILNFCLSISQQKIPKSKDGEMPVKGQEKLSISEYQKCK